MSIKLSSAGHLLQVGDIVEYKSGTEHAGVRGTVVALIGELHIKVVPLPEYDEPHLAFLLPFHNELRLVSRVEERWDDAYEVI